VIAERPNLMRLTMNTNKKQYGTTRKLAAIYGVEVDTIRRNLCTKGHFLGLKPIKLPNTRLLWPLVTPDELVKGGESA